METKPRSKSKKRFISREKAVDAGDDNLTTTSLQSIAPTSQTTSSTHNTLPDNTNLAYSSPASSKSNFSEKPLSPKSETRNIPINVQTGSHFNNDSIQPSSNIQNLNDPATSNASLSRVDHPSINNDVTLDHYPKQGRTSGNSSTNPVALYASKAVAAASAAAAAISITAAVAPTLPASNRVASQQIPDTAVASNNSEQLINARSHTSPRSSRHVRGIPASTSTESSIASTAPVSTNMQAINTAFSTSPFGMVSSDTSVKMASSAVLVQQASSLASASPLSKTIPLSMHSSSAPLGMTSSVAQVSITSHSPRTARRVRENRDHLADTPEPVRDSNTTSKTTSHLFHHSGNNSINTPPANTDQQEISNSLTSGQGTILMNPTGVSFSKQPDFMSKPSTGTGPPGGSQRRLSFEKNVMRRFPQVGNTEFNERSRVGQDSKTGPAGHERSTSQIVKRAPWKEEERQVFIPQDTGTIKHTGRLASRSSDRQGNVEASHLMKNSSDWRYTGNNTEQSHKDQTSRYNNTSMSGNNNATSGFIKDQMNVGNECRINQAALEIQSKPELLEHIDISTSKAERTGNWVNSQLYQSRFSGERRQNSTNAETKPQDRTDREEPRTPSEEVKGGNRVSWSPKLTRARVERAKEFWRAKDQSSFSSVSTTSACIEEQGSLSSINPDGSMGSDMRHARTLQRSSNSTPSHQHRNSLEQFWQSCGAPAAVTQPVLPFPSSHMLYYSTAPCESSSLPPFRGSSNRIMISGKLARDSDLIEEAPTGRLVRRDSQSPGTGPRSGSAGGPRSGSANTMFNSSATLTASRWGSVKQRNDSVNSSKENVRGSDGSLAMENSGSGERMSRSMIRNSTRKSGGLGNYETSQKENWPSSVEQLPSESSLHEAQQSNPYKRNDVDLAEWNKNKQKEYQCVTSTLATNYGAKAGVVEQVSPGGTRRILPIKGRSQTTDLSNLSQIPTSTAVESWKQSEPIKEIPETKSTNRPPHLNPINRSPLILRRGEDTAKARPISMYEGAVSTDICSSMKNFQNVDELSEKIVNLPSSQTTPTANRVPVRRNSIKWFRDKPDNPTSWKNHPIIMNRAVSLEKLQIPNLRKSVSLIYFSRNPQPRSTDEPVTSKSHASFDSLSAHPADKPPKSSKITENSYTSATGIDGLGVAEPPRSPKSRISVITSAGSSLQGSPNLSRNNPAVAPEVAQSSIKQTPHFLHKHLDTNVGRPEKIAAVPTNFDLQKSNIKGDTNLNRATHPSTQQIPTSMVANTAENRNVINTSHKVLPANTTSVTPVSSSFSNPGHGKADASRQVSNPLPRPAEVVKINPILNQGQDSTLMGIKENKTDETLRKSNIVPENSTSNLKNITLKSKSAGLESLGQPVLNTSTIDSVNSTTYTTAQSVPTVAESNKAQLQKESPSTNRKQISAPNQENKAKNTSSIPFYFSAGTSQSPETKRAQGDNKVVKARQKVEINEKHLDACIDEMVEKALAMGTVAKSNVESKTSVSKEATSNDTTKKEECQNNENVGQKASSEDRTNTKGISTVKARSLLFGRSMTDVTRPGTDYSLKGREFGGSGSFHTRSFSSEPARDNSLYFLNKKSPEISSKVPPGASGKGLQASASIPVFGTSFTSNTALSSAINETRKETGATASKIALSPKSSVKFPNQPHSLSKDVGNLNINKLHGNTIAQKLSSVHTGIANKMLTSPTVSSANIEPTTKNQDLYNEIIKEPASQTPQTVLTKSILRRAESTIENTETQPVGQTAGSNNPPVRGMIAKRADTWGGVVRVGDKFVDSSKLNPKPGEISSVSISTGILAADRLANVSQSNADNSNLSTINMSAGIAAGNVKVRDSEMDKKPLSPTEGNSSKIDIKEKEIEVKKATILPFPKFKNIASPILEVTDKISSPVLGQASTAHAPELEIAWITDPPDILCQEAVKKTELPDVVSNNTEGLANEKSNIAVITDKITLENSDKNSKITAEDLKAPFAEDTAQVIQNQTVPILHDSQSNISSKTINQGPNEDLGIKSDLKISQPYESYSNKIELPSSAHSLNESVRTHFQFPPPSTLIEHDTDSSSVRSIPVWTSNDPLVGSHLPLRPVSFPTCSSNVPNHFIETFPGPKTERGVTSQITPVSINTASSPNSPSALSNRALPHKDVPQGGFNVPIHILKDIDENTGIESKCNEISNSSVVTNTPMRNSLTNIPQLPSQSLTSGVKNSTIIPSGTLGSVPIVNKGKQDRTSEIPATGKNLSSTQKMPKDLHISTATKQGETSETRVMNTEPGDPSLEARRKCLMREDSFNRPDSPMFHELIELPKESAIRRHRKRLDRQQRKQLELLGQIPCKKDSQSDSSSSSSSEGSHSRSDSAASSQRRRIQQMSPLMQRRYAEQSSGIQGSRSPKAATRVRSDPSLLTTGRSTMQYLTPRSPQPSLSPRQVPSPISSAPLPWTRSPITSIDMGSRKGREASWESGATASSMRPGSSGTQGLASSQSFSTLPSGPCRVSPRSFMEPTLRDTSAGKDYKTDLGRTVSHRIEDTRRYGRDTGSGLRASSTGMPARLSPRDLGALADRVSPRDLGALADRVSPRDLGALVDRQDPGTGRVQEGFDQEQVSSELNSDSSEEENKNRLHSAEMAANSRLSKTLDSSISTARGQSAPSNLSRGYTGSGWVRMGEPTARNFNNEKQADIFRRDIKKS